MSASKPIIGVDVGGTFTDLFMFDEKAGRFRPPRCRRSAATRPPVSSTVSASSAPSPSSAPSCMARRSGPMRCWSGAGRASASSPRGFRDVLEMRRRDRRQTWGLWGEFLPIADRDLRLEVEERTLADGTVRTAVDEDAVRDAAKALREKGAEALAIIFINAYANADNEKQALDAARAVWPNEHVSASHQVLPEIREFERASTTALNAYLQPVVGKYLAKLEGALADNSFSGTFHIVQSNAA